MKACQTSPTCVRPDPHKGKHIRGPITVAADRLSDMDPVRKALLVQTAVVADRMVLSERAPQYWATVANKLETLIPAPDKAAAAAGGGLLATVTALAPVR